MTIEELTTYEKLSNAFYSCKKPSWWKEKVQKYEANLTVNLLQLQEELRNGTYKVDPTTNFTINERGKPREIKAPSIKDRIVQKVLCEYILVPQLSKLLIYDNYASLKNRGTSFARKRIDIMLRDYIRKYGDDGYVLQVDVKSFFGSIDHEILKTMIHSKIHESKEIMDLIDYCIDADGNKGLNLGSEAPQIFAIFYLSRLDNYIKCVKAVKYYGRYVDDLIIFSDDKAFLKALLGDILKQLEDVKLTINESKTHITKLSHGFTFMQIKYLVCNGKIIKRPTHKKVIRERQKLKRYKRQYELGNLRESDIRNFYLSWRNTIIKDCNRCKKTIASIDAQYIFLFPEREIIQKPSRTQIIQNAFRY